MVPRTIDKEIILTLSWLGPEFQLNLIAETFIDTTEGIKAGENCVLSFGQPKCHGMQHLSSRDKSVLGETIRAAFLRVLGETIRATLVRQSA